MLRTVAILTLLGNSPVPGCSECPPYEAEAIEYFYQHQGPIERLAEEITLDQRELITRGEAVGLIEMPDDPLPPDLIEKYRALFVDAGSIVEAVYFDDGVVRLYLGDYPRSGRIYAHFYVDTVDPTEYPICDEAKERNQYGFCSVPIALPWYLVYRWSSTDLNSELTDQFLAGEVDEEQHLEQNMEFVRDCFRKTAPGRFRRGAPSQ